jgi:hypothetical protein
MRSIEIVAKSYTAKQNRGASNETARLVSAGCRKPAMRMFLPKAPVRLDIILNTDWRKKLNSARAALKRTESRSKKGRSIISRNRAELGKVGLQISKPSPR